MMQIQRTCGAKSYNDCSKKMHDEIQKTVVAEFSAYDPNAKQSCKTKNSPMMQIQNTVA
jgi:hypothetical protein